MGLVNLEIMPRSETGKNANRRARAAGHIPAVLYGKERPSELISLDAHNFDVLMTHLSGRTALFSLEQAGKDDDITAMVREVQRNPVNDMVLHVDLMEIPRGEPVTLPIQIQVIGECPAVKNGEATVSLSLDMIEISVRPRDLPEFFEVDISELELHDKVFARDVKLGVGELVTDPDQLILNIKPQVVFVEEVEEAEGVEGAEDGEGASDQAEGDGEAKDGD